MPPAPSDPRHRLGRQGERLAEKYLGRRGLKTMARRYSTPIGELDLVMRDGDTVVFVEVKTRRDRVMENPEDGLRTPQRRNLLRVADWYVHNKRLDNCPRRFDVVAIVLPIDGPPEIEHFPDAFTPADR